MSDVETTSPVSPISAHAAVSGSSIDEKVKNRPKAAKRKSKIKASTSERRTTNVYENVRPKVPAKNKEFQNELKTVVESSKGEPDPFDGVPKERLQNSPSSDGVVYLNEPHREAKTPEQTSPAAVTDLSNEGSTTRSKKTSTSPTCSQRSDPEVRVLQETPIPETSTPVDVALSAQDSPSKDCPAASSTELATTTPVPQPRKKRHLRDGGKAASAKTESKIDSWPSTQTPVYDVPPKSRPLEKVKALEQQNGDEMESVNSGRTTRVNNIYVERTLGDKMSVSAEECSLDTVIVDKRYYDYMCQFRKNDIEPLQEVCVLDIRPVADTSSNHSELRIISARAGSREEWLQRFIDLYERLKQELVVEEVAMSELRDVDAYRDDTGSRHHCVFHAVDDALQIICERRALEGIRDITEKHRTEIAKNKQLIPVGYDISGAFYVYLYRADVTKLPVEAIAYITNENIQQRSEVAKSIIEAGGYKLIKTCRSYIRKTKIQPTDVIKTTAGNLPYKAVLHAVGQRWPLYGDENAQNSVRIQLLQMFHNVLVAADKERYRSVALCPAFPEQDNVPPDVISTSIKDSLLTYAMRRNRPKFKEIHIVDVTDAILALIADDFGEGSLMKTSSGQYVAVVILPNSETLGVTADGSRYEKLIDNSSATFRKAHLRRSNSIRRLLCSSNRRR